MQGCRPNAPKTCEGVMTPSQVCKHQVCDYCSGRFGMVTHRRWGNKFCKRTCKNAYLRENYRTLSDWIIPRFFFAGGACLAAALAVAVLTLLSLASAHAAPNEEQPAATVTRTTARFISICQDRSWPARPTMCAPRRESMGRP